MMLMFFFPPLTALRARTFFLSLRNLTTMMTTMITTATATMISVMYVFWFMHTPIVIPHSGSFLPIRQVRRSVPDEPSTAQSYVAVSPIGVRSNFSSGSHQPITIRSLNEAVADPMSLYAVTV